MKEAMRQNKRGMPVVHPSRKEGNQYALVFNQKGEILAPLRVVNLVAFPDKRTKDTSHASFFLRIKSIHSKQTLGWLTAARELRCTIATKNPEHTGLWVSLRHRQENTCCFKTFVSDSMDFLNSHCKDTTESNKLCNKLKEISKTIYVINTNLVN